MTYKKGNGYGNGFKELVEPETVEQGAKKIQMNKDLLFKTKLR